MTQWIWIQAIPGTTPSPKWMQDIEHQRRSAMPAETRHHLCVRIEIDVVRVVYEPSRYET